MQLSEYSGGSPIEAHYLEIGSLCSLLQEAALPRSEKKHFHLDT
jgi:hypothetical protein